MIIKFENYSSEKYHFDYCCVSVGDNLTELNFLVDNMEECPKEEFLQHVSFKDVQDNLNWVTYNDVGQFKKDWATRTFKYKGSYFNEDLDENIPLDVYILVNSAVEYVFKKN